MELFYQAMHDLQTLKIKLNLDEEYEVLTYVFDKNDYQRIIHLHEQNYCLETNEKSLYSPSLIVLLNYVVVNNIEDFNIYTLNNY